VISHDDPTNGEFQSDNSQSNKLDNALRKVSLNVELLQAFISEITNKNFQTRKTFVLKTDLFTNNEKEAEEEFICEPYYTQMSLEHALSATPSEIFLHLAEEIKQNAAVFDSNFKYIAVLSSTRYVANPGTKDRDMFTNTKGYCAMGKLSKKCLFK
jgi:hypothetical protein